MYDLLIKKGRLIDPAQKLDEQLDIAINQDRIAQVTNDIPSNEGRQVIDAEGKIVTPGLIDIHCHVYDSITQIGVEPDEAGVRQGVTTVVDAGSAGWATFGGFRKYVIPAARTSVFLFLHIGAFGKSLASELNDWSEIDVEATTATIEANRDLIKGVKLRMTGTSFIAQNGVRLVQTAKEVATRFGLPFMVHLGDRTQKVPPTMTQKYLPLLEKGDILSHIFTARSGGILKDDGRVMTELKEAADRGVLLDIANSRYNLNYDVADKCLNQGIIPDIISSDLTLPAITGPVYGLTVTMSKLLKLGLSLNQVIEMTTTNPAKAIREDSRIGSLKSGMVADVSVLQLLSGRWQLRELEDIMETNRLLSPVTTVKSGMVIPADPVAQPQPMD